MRTLSFFVLMLMAFTFSLTNAQQLQANHRGQYPRLLENGKIVDLNGRPLGSITSDGKILEVTGKVIGLITSTGEVFYADGKNSIGVISKRTLTTAAGYEAILDDGAITVAGQLVAFVDRGFAPQSYGCILHYFFSKDNGNAKMVDQYLNTML